MWDDPERRVAPWPWGLTLSFSLPPPRPVGPATPRAPWAGALPCKVHRVYTTQFFFSQTH